MMQLALYLCVVNVMVSYFVNCKDETELLFSKITSMDAEILAIKNKFATDIDFAMASLRSELKLHIKEQVRKAMAEILQGEPLEEMVRGQVVSEVRQLKHGHHQMKRQLHHVMKSLRDVEEDRETYKESLLKAERNASEVLTCSKYVVETKVLQRDLRRYEGHISEMTEENNDLKQNLRVLNETFQSILNDRKDVTAVNESEKETRTTDTTLPSTTPAVSYEPERNRIIAGLHGSSYKNQFRQISIHSNSPTNYPYLPMNYVLSLAFVSKSRKLLLGLYGPDRIVSSYLDTYGVKTVREGVHTYGIAVDEERELVFLTTRYPRHTISRMSTQGKHFTTIRLLVNYTSPYAIAVNTREEKLYSCNGNKLFMVTYDGRVIQTLATGSGIYAVTLDNKGALYYNDDKTLMKMTWSKDSYSITNVTTLEGTLWHLRHYRNSIYFGRKDSSGAVGVVDIAYGITSYSMKTFDMKSVGYLMFCLVP